MRLRGLRQHSWDALLLAMLSGWLGVPVQAAALDSEAQQHIRAATFEVVQLKPPEGKVEYDRPLPLELIPYQERTDKYRSVGTAFAIGPNRYVTAGHVLMLGLGGQFGPPALRDAAGNVHAIDMVLKYSKREDFAVFTLRDAPKGLQTLESGPRPAINDAVFAVGNALGEGIVIRDGVYTSDTPEEQDGQWKWLRFSAAASPGNSGGPLVDQHGKVVGVVLRKTEAENLNYALSIAQVTSASDGDAKIDNRSTIRLPVMDATETMEIHEHFTLPKALPEFYASVLAITEDQISQAQARLVAHNAMRLFPNGNGSAQLLHSTLDKPYPGFIVENRDGVWAVAGEKPETFQLDSNGFLEIKNGMIRVRAPDDVGLARLYGDSKLLMDFMLKGYPLRRQIGSVSVKVTSLGKAQERGNYVDSYGRVWLIRSWAVPFADMVLSALCLPTPEGYVLMLVPARMGMQDLMLKQQEMLTTYLYVTFSGTLAQWHDYLNLPGVQPRIFGTFKLDIDPDRHVHFQSKRCDLQVTSELVKLSKDSVLNMNFGFYRDGGAVVWDVGGLSVAEGRQKGNSVGIWRVWLPEVSLPQGFQDTWSKIQARGFPYNSTVFNNNGGTRIRAVADAGQGLAAKIYYVLTVDAEGEQLQAAMSVKLDLLQRSFKAFER